MATEYVVTAACVVAKVSNETGEGYFYRDAILPKGVPAKEKERLLDAGLVELMEVEVVVIPDPDEVVEVDPLDGLDLDGLKAYAETHQIDLGRATSEDGIRAKIAEAQQS